MWSMDFVQVPAEEEQLEELYGDKEGQDDPNVQVDQSESTKKRVHELVKQMSISTEGSGKLSLFIIKHLLYHLYLFYYCLYYNYIILFIKGC